MARKAKLDVRIRIMIWQKHLEDQPSEVKYRQWVEDTAAMMGVQPIDVRRVVTQECESLQHQLNEATLTVNQRLARRYGLTKEKAFRTMEAGLNANISVPLKGEKGATMMNEVTNRPRVFTQPDHASRAKFLDLFSKWMGMNAPEQQELTVRGGIGIVDLSDTAVRERIRQLAERVLEPGGSQRVIDIGGGAEGTALPAEPALLAPQRDEDQGRTRQDG